MNTNINTIEMYSGPPVHRNPDPRFRGWKPTPEIMMEKIGVLEDVVQALLDRIAKKEGIQLGVIGTATTHGCKYVLYEKPILKSEDSK